MNGLLVLDKPEGITSRDAVNRIQRLLPRSVKLGHAGTLDPPATGVLVLCLGQATRLAEYVQALPKRYVSRFRLGATSDTDDADGQITPRPHAAPPQRGEIEALLRRMTGTIEQVPPAYSAMLIDGQRAYAQARKGEEVELAARPVRVDRFELRAYDYPYLDVEIDCGKGTYVRSLARDLGERLGCGGLVESLRRTAIGPFTPEMAAGEVTRASLPQQVLPMARAVEHLPCLTLSPAEIQTLKRGQFLTPPPGSAPDQEFRVQDELGELHGVVYVHPKGQLRVSKMFL